MMANTRTVLASNWILNSCNCLCEHSIDTRKANLLLFRKIQRREFRSEEIGMRVDLDVGKHVAFLHLVDKDYF